MTQEEKFLQLLYPTDNVRKIINAVLDKVKNNN